MAKRVKHESQQLKEPAVIEQLYTVGEWSGQPQYRCGLCQFDCMRQEAILQHIEQVHFPKFLSEPAKRPSGILVADKNGNVVSQEQNLVGVYEVDLKEVLNNATNELT
ncbi:MAG: hypothetical protein CVU44_21045 [Chloroflexi bacterium HGW-Chloroflexi-6]|nr:MAG: hypothetical protein CVU44_21045 [Chloroflexi bacterium HGW-Chloroflexi-6]